MPTLPKYVNVMDIPEHLEVLQAIADQLMDDAGMDNFNVDTLYKRVVNRLDAKLRQQIERLYLGIIHRKDDEINGVIRERERNEAQRSRDYILREHSEIQKRERSLNDLNSRQASKIIDLENAQEALLKMRIAELALIGAQKRALDQLSEENARLTAQHDPLVRRRRSIS